MRKLYFMLIGLLFIFVACTPQPSEVPTEQPSGETIVSPTVTPEYSSSPTAQPSEPEIPAALSTSSPKIVEGSVAVFSMGTDYLMEKYLIEQDTVEVVGGEVSYNKTSKPTLLPSQIKWDAAQAVPVSSMMDMNISEEVYGEVTYDLYKNSGQSVYTGAYEFTPPTEFGDYYLFAYVGWGSEGNYKIYQYYLPMVYTNAVERAEGVEVIGLTPSSNGVDEFLEQIGEFTSEYENDTCFNVMPEDISQKYGFDVFKFDLSAMNMLLYDDQLVPLGEWFGGNGVHNFAVADINEDGFNELYFAYSSGSGMHRSAVSYFDTGTRQVVDFDYILMSEDAVLGVEDGVLGVYKAENMDSESFIDITFERGDLLATIENDHGNIALAERE